MKVYKYLLCEFTSTMQCLCQSVIFQKNRNDTTEGLTVVLSATHIYISFGFLDLMLNTGIYRLQHLLTKLNLKKMNKWLKDSCEETKDNTNKAHMWTRKWKR